MAITNSSQEKIWAQKRDVRVEMNDDGSWFYVEESRIPINTEEIINDFAKNQGFLTPLLGPGTFAYLAGETEVVMKIVDSIPFVTQAVVDLKTMLPATKGEEKSNKEVIFKPAFGVPGLEMAFTYIPPPTMRLILVTDTEYKNDLYLVAQHTETGHLYHPILPNIFSSGRVCMGGAKFPPFEPTKGLDGFLFNLFKSWSDAKWNADLVGAIGPGVHFWLKFDEKTRTNIIPKDSPWETLSLGKIAPPPQLSTALSRLHTRLSRK